jgi:hypothetical protein
MGSSNPSQWDLDRLARTRWSSSGKALAACALAGWLLAGCGFSHLAFTTDDRLHFLAPTPRALVRLPVTIRWDISHFEVLSPGSTATGSPSGSEGYFGVFVDRAPVRPGQSISAVADRSCRRTPGCVSAGYLADRGVYTTWEDAVIIRQVRVDSYQSTQTHEATVVLLDPAGRRIGESAWYIDFRMKKPQ